MPATSLPSTNQWRAHFKSRGIDEETARLYLSYIRSLVKKKVPVIFDREHLANLLGRTRQFLATASTTPHYFYRSFNIPKRSGGVRSIDAPYRSLLECQRWINDNILTPIPVHRSASAYLRNKSIRDNVAPHLGPREVLTIDLQNFFPSIPLARVIAVFLEIGYTKEVSLTLARLCCLGGVLPQGAPTSPTLSNIICRRLDNRIARLAAKVELSYTRYADDICLSGQRIPDGFAGSLSRIVKSEGFAINDKKTRRYSAANNVKMVTGLNVAANAPKLPRSFKRDVSLALYHINKHGLRSHLAKLKIHDPAYLDRLFGKIGYWLFIEPENQRANTFRQLLLDLLSRR